MDLDRVLTQAKRPAVAWSVIAALVAVLCGRELQRARVCVVSAADVARGERLVAAEVATAAHGVQTRRRALDARQERRQQRAASVAARPRDQPAAAARTMSNKQHVVVDLICDNNAEQRTETREHVPPRLFHKPGW